MASVEFDITAGSPRLTRTGATPDRDACTFCAWVKIVDYGDFIDIYGFEANSNQWVFIESDNTGGGRLRGIALKDGADEDATLWTDARTTWQFVAMTMDGTTARFYRRSESTSTLTVLPTYSLASIDFTATRSVIGASQVFAADIAGTIRYAGAKLYTAALSEAQLLVESTSFTPALTSGLTWANDCQSAATVEVDQSSTGGDFTKTGTPTDNADSPNMVLSGITRDLPQLFGNFLD